MILMPEGLVMDEEEIKRALSRIAVQIYKKNKDSESPALMGIQTEGEYLANIIAANIREQRDVVFPVGIVDNVTLDIPLSMRMFHPEEMDIILIDGVLQTGRRVAGALHTILDYYDEPGSVQLAVLVDRDSRKWPVKAGYVGEHIPEDFLSPTLDVQLKEEGGIYQVVTSPKSQ